jgi:hypothetical protein
LEEIERSIHIKTSAPTKAVFWVATILGAAALVSRFVTSLPIVGGNEFLTLAIAFVLLWLGNALKGM